MINDGRKLFTSDVECLDELSAGSWELSKEELNSVDNLLLEILIIDSKSCVSDWLARRKDLFDFSSNLTVINTLDIRSGKIFWFLLMRSSVLMDYGVVTIILWCIRFEESLWLESFSLWNRWLSWEVCKWIFLLFVVWCISWERVVLLVFVLGLVFAGIDLVECSSERIWGKDKKVILGWELGIHAVLGEEPLESVDHFVNSLLESLVLILVEFFHLLFELSGLLDEGLFLSSHRFVADISFLHNVLLESIEFLLEEVCPPFANNDEIVEEHVFSVVELVVSFLFVSVEDLNKWCSEIWIIDVIDGADGVVVEVDHDLSVLVELLEDLVLVVIQLTACFLVSFLENALKLLDKEGLSGLEHALLGSNNLFVVESVVLSDSCLVLKPFLALAFVELGGCINDDLFELLELGEDLSLDLVVVVLTFISVELLGKIGDRSPEVVLLLLELVSNDFSGIC